jgi:hypothetical protein
MILTPNVRRRIEERRQRAIEVTRELGSELGRSPTLGEIAERLGIAGKYPPGTHHQAIIGMYWGTMNGVPGASRANREAMYRAAGFEPRSAGTPGHRSAA